MSPDRHSVASRSAEAAGGYAARPGVVTLICVTSFIGIGAQAVVLLGLLAAVPGYAWTKAVPTALLGILVLGFTLAVVLGLWRAKDWARTVYVIVFPLLAVLAVIGEQNLLNCARLAILLPLCVLLFRPQADAYFRGERLPAIDPASGLEVGERRIIRCAACGKEVYSTVPRCHHCGGDPRPESPAPSAA
ncbi:MAG: hypothetical protein MI785_13325 [Kiloniellales bacterium]|nr:hypothetical protein [Kiloniellales bacterium]